MTIIITVPDVCCFQASWSSWLSLKLQRSLPARWGPGAHSDSPHMDNRPSLTRFGHLFQSLRKGCDLRQNCNPKRIEKWCTTIINNLPANFNDLAARLVVAKSESASSQGWEQPGPLLLYSPHPTPSATLQWHEHIDDWNAGCTNPCSSFQHPCNFFRGSGSAPGALRAKEIQGTASFLQLLPLLWAPFSQTCHSTPQELSAGDALAKCKWGMTSSYKCTNEVVHPFYSLSISSFYTAIDGGPGARSRLFFSGHSGENPKQLAKFQVSSYFSSFASSSFSRSAMRSWSVEWAHIP